MTQRNLSYLFIIVFISGCGRAIVKIPEKYSSLSKIEYCDLPKYENKEVILTSRYAGMQEYWSLLPIHSCDQDLEVDFDAHDYFYKMPEDMKAKFNHRDDYYYIVTAVGKYEKGNKNGYGHLGHLKSRFLVSEVLDVEVVKRWGKLIRLR